MKKESRPMTVNNVPRKVFLAFLFLTLTLTTVTQVWGAGLTFGREKLKGTTTSQGDTTSPALYVCPQTVTFYAYQADLGQGFQSTGVALNFSGVKIQQKQTTAGEYVVCYYNDMSIASQKVFENGSCQVQNDKRTVNCQPKK
jgi:hypothetical protein